MTTEDDFLKNIAAEPDNDELKAVYADFLEEKQDERCEYLRAVLKKKQLLLELEEIQEKIEKAPKPKRWWLNRINIGATNKAKTFVIEGYKEGHESLNSELDIIDVLTGLIGMTKKETKKLLKFPILVTASSQTAKEAVKELNRYGIKVGFLIEEIGTKEGT